jgi:hypothetical protein
VSESFLREALLASGATGEEAARFARALVDRIRQLGDAALEAGRTRT